MIAKVSAPNPTITSSCPTGSNRRGRSARDSGTYSAVSTIAATPIGTLTKNTARQLNASTSAPPRTGPSAMLSPITAPHTPIAWARSRGSVNTLRMIDIATGLSIEPPIACSTRAAISKPSDGASPHSSDPSENTANLARKVRRRPTRSAVDPASISRLAITSV